MSHVTTVVRRPRAATHLATDAEIDALFAFLRSVHAEPDEHEELTLTKLMLLVPRVAEFVEQLADSSGDQKLELALALMEGALRRINQDIADEAESGEEPIVFLTDDEIALLTAAIRAVVAASGGAYNINKRARALVRWARAVGRGCHAAARGCGACGARGARNA